MHFEPLDLFFDGFAGREQRGDHHNGAQPSGIPLIQFQAGQCAGPEQVR